MTDARLLQTDELTCGYGRRMVLSGISIGVQEREMVALLGHNGAGKSTLLKCIFGLLRPWDGGIRYNGALIGTTPAHVRVKLGISFIPQGNRVFDELTILENLEVWARAAGRRDEVQGRVREAMGFLTLVGAGISWSNRRRDRAGVLSGGEKQVLLLACALSQRPRLLLLDEPSLGLSPEALDTLLTVLRGICSESGRAILMVEQRVSRALQACDRAYVLRLGKIVLTGEGRHLLGTEALRQAFLS